MEVKALKVLSSINLDDLGLAIPTDFVGVIKVASNDRNPLTRNAFLRFDGKGVITYLRKEISYDKIDIIVTGEVGSVKGFIETFSKACPGYAPLVMSKREFIDFKRLKGEEDNLHPIRIS